MPYVFQGIAAFWLLNSLSFVILLSMYINKVDVNKVDVNKVDVNKVGRKAFCNPSQEPPARAWGPSTGAEYITAV